FGGLVAGEGSFTVSPYGNPHDNGDPRLRFVFSVKMAARDRPLLEALARFLGVGSVNDSVPTNPRWLPTSQYIVPGARHIRDRVVPFGEPFLLPSAKRTQFDAWVALMRDYDEAHPSRYGKGPSTCSQPGCGKPVRGRGLCRSHYYRATGY